MPVTINTVASRLTRVNAHDFLSSIAWSRSPTIAEQSNTPEQISYNQLISHDEYDPSETTYTRAVAVVFPTSVTTLLAVIMANAGVQYTSNSESAEEFLNNAAVRLAENFGAPTHVVYVGDNQWLICNPSDDLRFYYNSQGMAVAVFAPCKVALVKWEHPRNENGRFLDREFRNSIALAQEHFNVRFALENEGNTFGVPLMEDGLRARTVRRASVNEDEPFPGYRIRARVSAQVATTSAREDAVDGSERQSMSDAEFIRSITEDRPRSQVAQAPSDDRVRVEIPTFDPNTMRVTVNGRPLEDRPSPSPSRVVAGRDARISVNGRQLRGFTEAENINIAAPIAPGDTVTLRHGRSSPYEEHYGVIRSTMNAQTNYEQLSVVNALEIVAIDRRPDLSPCLDFRGGVARYGAYVVIKHHAATLLLGLVRQLRSDSNRYLLGGRIEEVAEFNSNLLRLELQIVNCQNHTIPFLFPVEVKDLIFKIMNHLTPAGLGYTLQLQNDQEFVVNTEAFSYTPPGHFARTDYYDNDNGQIDPRPSTRRPEPGTSEDREATLRQLNQLSRALEVGSQDESAPVRRRPATRQNLNRAQRREREERERQVRHNRANLAGMEVTAVKDTLSQILTQGVEAENEAQEVHHEDE